MPPASDKPLRFAVIGCGLLAQGQHLPNIQRSGNAELQVCCDLHEEYLRTCRERFSPRQVTTDFREAIHDPEVEAILVATGEKFRIPIYEEAAAAGKPVYTEKPLADTWENARRAQGTVKKAGIPFCVGHNRRCSPAIVRAQEIFRRHMSDSRERAWRFNRAGWESIDVKGQDGVPCLSIRINDDWHSWKAVHLTGLNADYGLLLGEMTHFADLARLFLGSEAKRVVALHNGVLNHSVSIEFGNGAMANILMGSNGSFGYPKELLEVMGNGGMLVCDHMLEIRTAGIKGAEAVEKFSFLNDRHPQVGREGGLYGWLAKKRETCREAAEKGDPLLQFGAEPDKGHFRMLEEFIREVRGERGAVSPIDDAIEATRICLAAIRSAKERRIVEVSEIG